MISEAESKAQAEKQYPPWLHSFGGVVVLEYHEDGEVELNTESSSRNHTEFQHNLRLPIQDDRDVMIEWIVSAARTGEL